MNKNVTVFIFFSKTRDQEGKTVPVMGGNSGGDYKERVQEGE
jgi:hypothetical protein